MTKVVKASVNVGTARGTFSVCELCDCPALCCCTIDFIAINLVVTAVNAGIARVFWCVDFAAVFCSCFSFNSNALFSRRKLRMF